MRTPTECLHPMVKISHEFSWKIENFSKLDDKICHQKKFTAGDQGNNMKVKDDNVSLYMNYNGSFHDTSAMKISVELSLSIIDQIEGNHNKRTLINCAGIYLQRKVMPLPGLRLNLNPNYFFIAPGIFLLVSEVTAANCYYLCCGNHSSTLQTKIILPLAPFLS
ncbi:hypothetical protein KSP40_PGU005673 [Platanthera guangdongensis]|uniref:Uncharacterized protein n=1 Tax=Platanthera guangdongensis TaxID=2320717 RepID=A0ABR2MD91_9ASPA